MVLIRKILVTGFLMIGLIIGWGTQIAWADANSDLIAQGNKVFSANCSACHINGGNIVAANKNLKLETLKQYGMDSAEAVITQVTNGKNAMPAFKSRLNDDQIKAVAAYVLAQAENGWKK